MARVLFLLSCSTLWVPRGDCVCPAVQNLSGERHLLQRSRLPASWAYARPRMLRCRARGESLQWASSDLGPPACRVTPEAEQAGLTSDTDGKALGERACTAAVRKTGRAPRRESWWGGSRGSRDKEIRSGVCTLHVLTQTSKTTPEPLTPPEKPMADVSRVAIYLLNGGLPPT
ncbi:unnamed protein product [Rangifer tarandus platyrhynchus]|uniref:Uncharacterized protein n=1 Tax=Rangifer tarandus platyrhynchus TaxID=3082113 RepID=A0ABN8YPH4_RANTA|nr:unnamed protein product [Rangifer tarandus platyrhynchus]